MKVTVWSWPDLAGIGPFAVKLLTSLGYRASLKQGTPGEGYFGDVGDSRNRAQAGVSEWISDYPAASGFFASSRKGLTARIPNNAAVSASFAAPT